MLLSLHGVKKIALGGRLRTVSKEIGEFCAGLLVLQRVWFPFHKSLLFLIYSLILQIPALIFSLSTFSSTKALVMDDIWHLSVGPEFIKVTGSFLGLVFGGEGITFQGAYIRKDFYVSVGMLGLL